MPPFAARGIVLDMAAHCGVDMAKEGTAAMGTDTWAVDVVAFESGADAFEVRQRLSPMNGTHILEHINTAARVTDKAWEFMFVLGHNKYQGAVQSMIDPVAIRGCCAENTRAAETKTRR